MAYAAYCDQSTALATPRATLAARQAAHDALLRAARGPRAGVRRASTVFCVMAVTVDCAAAPCVRRAVAHLRDCGVLRCEPHLAGPDEGRVTLVIRLPRTAMGDVMEGVLRCVPCGEFGRLTSWSEHLAAVDAAAHGHAH